MNNEWDEFTKVDDHADEVPHRHTHRLKREKVESIIASIRDCWDSYLPRTFIITIMPSEQYWKMVAIDESKNFRSSAFMLKTRAYEERVIAMVHGLMNDYFIETDSMPLRWGEYI